MMDEPSKIARLIVTQWRLQYGHDLTDEEQDALELRIVEAIEELLQHEATANALAADKLALKVHKLQKQLDDLHRRTETC